MRWKRALYITASSAAAAAVVFMLLPEPASVDAGEVTVGPLEVTVEDQGETRSHDRFVVTAPVPGRLMRIELHDGDRVSEGQLLAQLAPLPLSVREQQEQRARIAAAEALQREAAEHVRRVESDLALARVERSRVEKLVKDGALATRDADRARNLEVTTADELEAARFRAASAKAQVELARAGLVVTRPVGGPGGELVQIRSPSAGRILRIEDPSERVVAAGTPLMTLGNLDKLEVVIELLSSEAVKVEPGMPVRVEGWGGEPLRARVRRVEPRAFTKISALGVEEKRTNVIADFVDPPGSLGDGFRVEGRIVVWRGERVTKLPTSALFRCGGAFCAFAVADGRAVRRALELGHRNALEAEVVRGLKAGQKVIRHPGNDIQDGDRVRIRTPEQR